MKSLFWVALLLLTLLVAPLYAQDDPDTCANTLTKAVMQMAQACAGLARDTVCYGESAAVYTGESAFSRLTDAPGSSIAMEHALTVKSMPLDVDAGTYGAALLNLSVNLPQSVPGALFLLLGDARIQNAVPEDRLFVPIAPIKVRVEATAANLRTRPSTYDSVLFSAAWGTELYVDGVSPDGEWYRVGVAELPAWVHRLLVAGEGLESLPVIDSEKRTWMQDFTLTTRDSTPDPCRFVPNVLVMQGLSQQPVEVRANGAEIYFLSTVALQAEERPASAFLSDPVWMAQFGAHVTFPAQRDATCQFLRLMAIDGQAFLNNYHLGLPRGHQALAFDCDGDDTVLWNRITPIPYADLMALSVLEALPEGALRETVNLVSPQEIAQIAAQLASAVPRPAAPPPQPEAPSPEPEAPQPVASPTPRPVVAGCGGFGPTHPLGQIGFGYVRFYWDPAPGATHYQVNLMNEWMVLLRSYQTFGAETNVRVETMTGSTYYMYYEILAFQGETLICQTPLIGVIRDMPPDPDCPSTVWFTDQMAEVCEEGDFVTNDP